MGTHVTEALRRREHTVLLLSREPIKEAHIIGDLLSNGWQKEAEAFAPDAIIHLAWEGIPDYSAAMSVRNTAQGLAVFAFASRIGCKKVLVTGSGWEKMKQNAFTAAKNTLRLFGEAFAQEDGSTFIWARLFFVYGPHQRKEALIPSLTRALIAKEIPVLANPAAQNDFVYVGDVADAIGILIEKASSGIYEVGSGEPTSVGEVARMVHEAFSLPFEVAAPSASEPPLIAHTAELEALGWQRAVTLQKGVAQTVAWLRSTYE